MGLFSDASQRLELYPPIGSIPFVIPATDKLEEAARLANSAFLADWVLPGANTTNPAVAALEWVEDLVGYTANPEDDLSVPPFIRVVYEPGHNTAKFITFRVEITSVAVLELFAAFVIGVAIPPPNPRDLRYTAVAHPGDQGSTVAVDSLRCAGNPVGVTVPSWAIGKFIGYQGVTCKDMIRRLPSVDWLSLTYIDGNMFGLHHIKVPTTISKPDSVQLARWVDRACIEAAH
jgi:hypothetical protein